MFFLPAAAPVCSGNDCYPEASPVAGEPASSAGPQVVLAASSKPFELTLTDAATVEELRRPAEAGFLRADASVSVVQPLGSVMVAPRVSSGSGPSSAVIDASKSAPVSPQDGAAPRPRAEEAGTRTGVHCGSAICPEGQVCCNASCGACRPPGASCSQVLCGPISPYSAPCGNNTCNVGEVCCNASCGICTQPGGTCSQQPCKGVEVPISTLCGPNTCNVGQVCCNASCGICTNPGETCRREPCP